MTAADLAVQPERDAAGLRGGMDRFEGRETEVAHENLHLPVVPMAVGNHGKARLASAQDGHAGGVRALNRFDAVDNLALEDVDQRLVGAELVAEIDHVGLERQRRRNRDLALDHGFQRPLVHAGRVEDEVESGLGGAPSGVRSATVAHDRGAEIVRGIADQREFVVRPDAEFTPMRLSRHDAGHMHLDPVRADLDLPADLLDDIVLAVDHLVVARHALVVDEPPRSPAHARDERVRAAGDARTLHHAGVDRVAHVDHALVDRIRVEHAGDAGAQEFSRVGGRDHGREGLPTMVEDLRVGGRVVEG